jgi:hypothetical protein
MAAPPLIAPGICRYTVNGGHSGRTVANVFDYRIDTTGSVASRAEAVEDMAGILINEWSDHVLVVAPASVEARSVSWVDLDDEDGTTGERAATTQENWPQAGASSSHHSAASNVAYMWTKQTTGGRSTRNGRTYLVGVAESWTTQGTPNALDATTLAALQAQANNFLGNTNQDGAGIFDWTSTMVVVHTSEGAIYPPSRTPSRTFRSATDVTELTVNNVLATQRRRLRS